MTRTPLRLLLAVLLLGTQVAIAAAMLPEPRPAPYGWQMYSAVPYNPPAWTVTDRGEEPFNAEGLLVHGRAEIDRVALLRNHGCDLTGAEAIRMQLQDGSLEEVTCP